MGIYDSKIWISDLDRVLTILPELDDLCGRSVLITGCNGLICSAILDVLIRWNIKHEGKIRIFAAGRSESKVKERFLPYFHEEWFEFVFYDASLAENNFDFSCDYIIHGASNASPNKIAKYPVETMMSNFMGIKLLLDYAREQDCKRVLYISTSEVYGRKDCDRPRKIDEYGWIDILNSRSSYSIGKCAAETLCASYYDEYGVEFVIVRPGHIYGPTAGESDNRVSSIWAYAAARGENIIMKSNGSQIRSYCYCLDSASAILKVLLKGEPFKAYNISNPNSIIDIRRLATIFAQSAGVKMKIEIPTEVEKRNFNPMQNSSIDSTELLALGWQGMFDPEQGIYHTVKILREICDRIGE